MKPLFVLLIFSFANMAFAAERTNRPLLEIMKEDGYLALCDNSSYFVFSKDGTFSSFPVGMSGRELRGTWTHTGENPIVATVVAKTGWLNGAQPNNAYRKIVFAIYGGNSEALPNEHSDIFSPDLYPGDGKLQTLKIQANFVVIKRVYRGYFIIEEFTSAPKPD